VFSGRIWLWKGLGVGDTNRQVILVERPSGPVSTGCFALREAPVPEPGPGEVLLRTLLVSIDPAIRGWIGERGSGYLPPVEIGAPVRSNGVGEVVASRNDDLPVGTIATALTGWQEFAIAGTDWNEPFKVATAVPDGASPLEAVAALGQQSLTAWAGMRVLAPTEGESVVVSAAASAVGSVAGQLAKRAGARVVGIAGTADKCTWVVDELGFDACIDYRTEDVAARLRELCPGGVDVVFDNVGGELLDTLLRRIAVGARILLCGSLSTDDGAPPHLLRNHPRLMSRRATMMGFNTIDHWHLYGEATAELAAMTRSGELITRTELVDGLEHAPEQLVRMFAGDHLGKLIVKVAD
jgi:NADPH-dependent curcumin reductase CurA